MVIYLSLLVALIGLILMLITSKFARVGEIMFFCGLLAFLFHFAGPAIQVVR